MAMWRGYTDWTPPEQVVELVAAIAAGELDQWSGRFLRAGKDDLDVAPRGSRPQDAARQLRLAPYGTTTRSPERRPTIDWSGQLAAQCGRRIRQNG